MRLPRRAPAAALAVHPWPASRALLATASGARADLLVISVATPDSQLRDAARAQLRGALCEVLGLQLERSPESIALISVSGQALRLDGTGHGIGLSASHEAGLSVAAINRHGPVGVDIMRIPTAFDWQATARDYLGPQAVHRIADRPRPEQLRAFTREWTRLEAGLKCQGLALQEWTPALAQSLASCHLMELDMPSGLCGAVAWC